MINYAKLTQNHLNSTNLTLSQKHNVKIQSFLQAIYVNLYMVLSMA